MFRHFLLPLGLNLLHLSYYQGLAKLHLFDLLSRLFLRLRLIFPMAYSAIWVVYIE